MSEALYAERPDVYDVLYADKDYEGEVEWVCDRLADHGVDAGNALVVGCGTGEHSARLEARGFDVTGVDRYEAMVERARTKSGAEFTFDRLPDLSVDGSYDLVWAPFTVVNHLPPDEFGASVRSMADRLSGGGLLVVDTISVPDEETPPRLRAYEGPDGEYARMVQTYHVEGRRSRWDSLVFTPDGGVFVDTHDLWNYDEAFVEGVFAGAGLAVESSGWYGSGESDDEASVYVGRG